MGEKSTFKVGGKDPESLSGPLHAPVHLQGKRGPARQGERSKVTWPATRAAWGQKMSLSPQPGLPSHQLPACPRGQSSGSERQAGSQQQRHGARLYARPRAGSYAPAGLWGWAVIGWPPGPGTEQVRGPDSRRWVGRGKARPHCASPGSVRTTYLQVGRGEREPTGPPPAPHPTESGSPGTVPPLLPAPSTSACGK